MTYKDPDRQKEANRQASQRRRDKGMTQGMTMKDEFPRVIPEGAQQILDVARSRLRERTAGGNIKVSKPGDADYVPQCETTRAFVRDSGLCPYCLKRPIMSDNAISCEECSGMTLVDTPKPKRGKDIKHFGDLPMDV